MRELDRMPARMQRATQEEDCTGKGMGALSPAFLKNLVDVATGKVSVKVPKSFLSK